jgi:hypothetical protein
MQDCQVSWESTPRLDLANATVVSSVSVLVDPHTRGDDLGEFPDTKEYMVSTPHAWDCDIMSAAKPILERAKEVSYG